MVLKIKKFDIEGMSCAACSMRVEKAVSALEKVKSCQVNLLTNSMTVEGEVTEQEIIFAVEKAGYKAFPQGTKEDKGRTETKKSLKRLIVSLGLLIPLMYISMGHNMLSLPLPQFLHNSPLFIGLLQMILTGIIIFINRVFFVSGFKAILNKSPNMDTLISMGSGVSFLYSIYIVLQIAMGGVKNLHNLYFESAAMILVLITIGKTLEAHSKGKTTSAIKGLMDLSPKLARVEREGKEVSILASEVQVGDVFIVLAGESIPADGIVIFGETSVDESALTGESIPSDKSENSSVFAGTINMHGYIKCKATKELSNTTLFEIIKTVTDASNQKAPIAKTADKVSGIFVPIVIGISIITFIIWLFLGQTIGFSIARAVSVLVISCPCSLGLATPVAIMVGSGVGAKNGILFKTAVSLEAVGKAKTIILDKTGTITKGVPAVTDILEQKDRTELLKYAYSLEKMSEHPLASAIVKKAESEAIERFSVDDFEVLSGSGLSGNIERKRVIGGNLQFVAKETEIPKTIRNKAEELSSQGKTPLFFAKEGEFLGLIAVADSIRNDSAEAIKEIKKMGINVVMLTGDNKNTAEAISKTAGVNNVIAEVMPKDKAEVVSGFKEQGMVVMVGDGINDAPALTVADVGVAVGEGADIAIDSADIVLMKAGLITVVNAIKLSRKTLKNIKENLFWAFIYNIIGIPLAAGAFISLFGWEMNPMFGAAAMSLSSICVVSNALRLNFINFEKLKKEKKKMEKTLKIEGMMCVHCEARVKKLLENLAEVDEAIVSHEKGIAELKLNSEISDKALKELIENEGYKVL